MQKSRSGADMASWARGSWKGQNKGNASPRSISNTGDGNEIAVLGAISMLKANGERGAEELASLVTRQAATYAGELLRQHLRLSGKKLQELGSSKSSEHRRACVIACEAILSEKAKTFRTASSSIVQEYILLLHKALENTLKHAVDHHDVTHSSVTIGKVLSAASTGSVGKDIATAVAYQSTEWLDSDRPHRVHAGAALARELGLAPAALLTSSLAVMMSGALPKALAGDVPTRDTAALSISALAPHYGCGPVLLRGCVLAIKQPSSRYGGFKALKELFATLPSSMTNPYTTEVATEALRWITIPTAVSLLTELATTGHLQKDKLHSFTNTLLDMLRQQKCDPATTTEAFTAISTMCDAGTGVEVLRKEVKWLHSMILHIVKERDEATAETAAVCLASLAAGIHDEGIEIDQEMMNGLCGLTLTPTIVRVLSRVTEAHPLTRIDVSKEVLKKASEVLSSTSSSGTVIACMQALEEAVLATASGPKFVTASVVPLLRRSANVKQAAARLCCTLASQTPTDIHWVHPLSEVLSVAVTEASIATRIVLWKYIESISKPCLTLLAAQECCQCICLSLGDPCEVVSTIAMELAVKLSDRCVSIPPRIRSAVLRHWDSLQVTPDPLEQARAAKMFVLGHAALLASRPCLIPPMLMEEQLITTITKTLESSVPIVQAALFDVLTHLLAVDIQVSQDTLSRLEQLAVTVIRGDYGLASTKPAALSLTAIVQKSGASGTELLMRHEGLLKRLLDCLKGATEETEEVRHAVMKLLGTLGAISPNLARSLLEKSSGATDDLPWGVALTNEKYYAYRVLRAMYTILRQPRLRSFHNSALKALQIPLKMIEKVESIIHVGKDLIPTIVEVADSCFIADDHSITNLRAVFQALNTILSMIRFTIDPSYLSDLMRVAKMGIELGEAQTTVTALQLIETVAGGMGVGFAPEVGNLVRTLCQLVVEGSFDESVNIAAVKTLEGIGPVLLRPYVYHVAQQLCACMSRYDSPPPLKGKCIEAVTKLVIQNSGGHDAFPLVFHSLVQVVHQITEGYEANRSPGTANLTFNNAGWSCTDVWTAAACALGHLYRSHLGSISSSLFKVARSDTEAAGLELGIEPRVFQETWSGPDYENVLESSVAPGGPAKEATKQDPNTREVPYPLDHDSIVRALQGFGSPSLWLGNLAQTILGESPRSALVSASSVARDFTPLAFELFGAAFTAVCSEPARITTYMKSEVSAGKKHDSVRMNRLLGESKNTQRELLRTVSQVMTYSQLPREVIQRLLHLAEFYERYEEATAAVDKGGAPMLLNKPPGRYILTPMELCRLAEQCGLHAKALHWAEAEVIRKGDVPEACRSLVKACKALEVGGADEGVLAVLKSTSVVNDASLQEDLGRCDKALTQYTLDENREGIVRCHEKLGNWRELMDTKLTPETSLSVARASWVLGEWDSLERAAHEILIRDTSGPSVRPGIGQFYLAVVSAQRGEYGTAREYIFSGRRELDGELNVYLTEGYSRSYDTLVSIQQLAELEEIIDYKSSAASMPAEWQAERLQHLKHVWNTRSKNMLMDPLSLRGTLTQRSLLVQPHEDPKPWLDFAASCKNPWEKKHATEVLKLVVKGRDLNISELILEGTDPEVLLAILKHQWDTGPRTAELVKDASLLAEYCNESNYDAKAQSLVLSTVWMQEIDVGKDTTLESLEECVDISKHLSGEVRETVWKEWARYHSKEALAKNSVRHALQAMNGFVKSVNADDAQLSAPAVLQLLHLVFLYKDKDEVVQHANSIFSEVPTPLWIQVVPQVVARLGETGKLGSFVEELLCYVAAYLPGAVIYSLLPPLTASSSTAPRVLAAERVIQHIAKKFPSLVSDARLMALELTQTAVLFSEKWKTALEDAHSNSRMYPLDALSQLMQRLKSPVNLDEYQFKEMHGSALLKAEEEWTNGGINDEAANRRGWVLCTEVHRHLQGQQMQGNSVHKYVNLERTAPGLHASKDFSLPVPGFAAEPDPPLIKSFQDKLTILASKTRPKRISLLDNRGATHGFLLKGHEDLRLDERIMQLLGLVNSLMHKQGCGHAPDIMRFPVIPLGANVGLLGWVTNAEDLNRVVMAGRNPSMREYEKTLIKTSCNITKVDNEWGGLTITSRVTALKRVAAETDGDDIHRALWLGSASSEEWVTTRSTYTRSLAVMSMVGHVIGLGDRHMENIMLQKGTGRVAHIDYGDCFDVARERSRYPEKVPFRLTRQLGHATGVGGVRGVFRRTSIRTMEVLHSGRELVVAMLEAFLHDPLIQWKVTEASRVVGCILTKLDPGTGGISNKVDDLVAEATDCNNIAAAYQGWRPWL